MENLKRTLSIVSKMVFAVAVMVMLNGLSAHAATFSYNNSSFDTSKAIKTRTVDGISYSEFLLDNRNNSKFDLSSSDKLYLIYMSGSMTSDKCEYFSVICDYFPEVENACIMMDCKFRGQVSNGNCDEDKISYYDDFTVYDLQFGRNLDTSNVTSMYCMFQGLEKIKSLDASRLNTSKVKDMRSMFCNCLSLESLNVSKFDTRLVEDMAFMFAFCESLETIDVSNFNTENVTNMRGMFGDCIRLQSVDVSNFNTCKVTNMRAMFAITSISNIDISNFNTALCTSMRNMFSYCSNLESLDMSHLNTPRVTDMEEMLSGCISLEELNLSNQVIVSDINLNTCDSLTKLYLNNTLFETTNKLSEELSDLPNNKEYKSLVAGRYNCSLVKGACNHMNITKAVAKENLLSAATCTEAAVYCYECADCHTKLNETFVYGKALGHTSVKEVVPATTKNDGYISCTCSECGEELSRTEIAKAYIEYDETAQYTGKAIAQPVKVLTADNKVIPSKYYTVSYKNNTKVGEASIVIKFKGNYAGTVTKYFNIEQETPEKVAKVSLTAGKNEVKVAWTKCSGKIAGYEIQYSTKKDFSSSVKKINVTGNKNKTTSITKLKSKTTYYVRMRSYTKNGSSKVYSAWTTVSKAVKTK